MNKESIMRVGLPVATVLASIGIGFAGISSAQTAASGTTSANTPAGMHAGMRGQMPHGPGFGKGMIDKGRTGTVTAVSGNTITITGKDGSTYTVDASGAQISKTVSIGVGDIQVGDTLGVGGTVSGNTITAQHIMDGVPPQPQQ